MPRPPELADIPALLELCEKATAGPWSTDWYGIAGVFENGQGHVKPGQCAFCGNTELTLVAEKPALPLELQGPITRKHIHRGPSEDWHDISNFEGIPVTGNYDYEEGGVCSTKDDAQFIAASRTALPAALKYVQELEQEGRLLEVVKAARELSEFVDYGTQTELYKADAALRKALEELNGQQ